MKLVKMYWLLHKVQMKKQMKLIYNQTNHVLQYRLTPRGFRYLNPRTPPLKFPILVI